jgi:hypothetical protein
VTIECYHGNCPFHAIEVPLCTEEGCHFPNDILVWPDGSWGYPDEYSHAERVLGDFLRIITNGVSEEELDLVAHNAAYGNVRSFAYPLKWFRTTRPDYLL